MKPMNITELVQQQRDFFHTDTTKSVLFRKQALRNLAKWIDRHEHDIYTALKSDLNKSSFESYMTEIGIVKKGESGYYRSDLTPVYGEDGKQFVEELNQKGGITKAQEAAMLAGSMFGWQAPAADPRNYDEQGQPIKRKNKDRGEAR